MRALLVGGVAAAVVAVILGTAFALEAGGVTPPGASTLGAPFLAGAAAVVGVRIAGPWLRRAGGRVAPARTPYTALAAVGSRSVTAGGGDVGDALAGIAQVLAEGTRARSATVWLALETGLVAAAVHPAPAVTPPAARDLAALLGRDDVHHAVPVLDDTEMRAVLVLDKPGQGVSPADRRLVRDVAAGAALLLREVRHSTELATRVRRADDLARELADSRARLTRARDAERRRLVAELAHATTDRLTSLRSRLTEADGTLGTEGADAGEVLARAVEELDELLERFRTIVRGVYPSVLAAQGPRGALEEMAADLPRPVTVTGELPRRRAREIESGLYYVAASATAHLAGRSGVDTAGDAVELALSDGDGHLTVRVSDPVADPDPAAVAALHLAVADDLDRLAALGGDVDVVREGGRVRLVAWVPDDLEPGIDGVSFARPETAR